VNAFEPNCAIVTSVDLDHQDFLGDTREKIGLEKSGVYRQAVSAICGDRSPPNSLINFANQIQADLKLIQQDFDGQLYLDGWQYRLGNRLLYTLPLPALKGEYQLGNAACAITAVESLQSILPVNKDAIANALLQVKLAGRFQTVSQSPQIILDVAHNPHAARAFASNLMASRNEKQHKVFAVFAILADKDIKGVVEAVKTEVDVWYVASISNVRGALADDVALIIKELVTDAKIKTFGLVEDAYLQACIDLEACIDASENDKIAVFGSFFTVSSVMQLLENQSASCAEAKP
jgi:dihydrofolate synthase/folylpolyglutamate synthase